MSLSGKGRHWKRSPWCCWLDDLVIIYLLWCMAWCKVSLQGNVSSVMCIILSGAVRHTLPDLTSPALNQQFLEYDTSVKMHFIIQNSFCWLSSYWQILSSFQFFTGWIRISCEHIYYDQSNLITHHLSTWSAWCDASNISSVYQFISAAHL